MSSEAEVPKRMSDPQIVHTKFFLIFLLSYVTAENITLILNSTVPLLFTPLSNIFNELTISLVVGLLTLVFARVYLTLLPELATPEPVVWYIAIIPSLIMAHPLFLSIAGSTFTAIWMVVNIIENGQIITLLLETLLFAFVGYGIMEIQGRSSFMESRLAQILRYLGQDILFGLFALTFVIYLVRSFVQESLESITITIPVKLVLVLLFYVFTNPIAEEEMDASTSEETNETKTAEEPEK